MKIRNSFAAIIVAASLVATSVVADRSELSNFDQPFVYFKTMGKYPVLSTYNPVTNSLKCSMCGTCNNEAGKAHAIKTPTDLENLTILRSIDKLFDAGIQFDKKFDGYRDATAAVALQEALTLVKLMTKDTYKGSVLVDEVKQGFPMRWVLNNNDELKGILSYLEKSITEPLVKKPVLVIDILNGNIDEETAARLSNLFDVADRNDKQVKKFFNKTKEILNDLPDRDLDYEGESFGEAVLRQLEGKSCYKLKAKNIAIAATVAIATGLTFTLAQKLAEKMTEECVRDPIKNKIYATTTAVKNKVASFF